MWICLIWQVLILQVILVVLVFRVMLVMMLFSQFVVLMIFWWFLMLLCFRWVQVSSLEIIFFSLLRLVCMFFIRLWCILVLICLFNCLSLKDRWEIGVCNLWDIVLVSLCWLLIRFLMWLVIWLKCWVRVWILECWKMCVCDDRLLLLKCCVVRCRVLRLCQCGWIYISRVMLISMLSRMQVSMVNSGVSEGFGGSLMLSSCGFVLMWLMNFVKFLCIISRFLLRRVCFFCVSFVCLVFVRFSLSLQWGCQFLSCCWCLVWFSGVSFFISEQVWL